jgi:hypothetical protein
VVVEQLGHRRARRVCRPDEPVVSSRVGDMMPGQVDLWRRPTNEVRCCGRLLGRLSSVRSG